MRASILDVKQRRARVEREISQLQREHQRNEEQRKMREDAHKFITDFESLQHLASKQTKQVLVNDMSICVCLSIELLLSVADSNVIFMFHRAATGSRLATTR